jgi:RimJ/RimL family protein N-acetyltransferase
MDARSYRIEDILKDGTPIVIRAIRPDDRDRLRTAFGKLGRETRYMRFFSFKDECSDSELSRATEVDFENEVALLITRIDNGQEVAIAGSRYIAYDGSDGSRVAEVAFTVADGYQGQGLASRLLGHLTTIAQAKGIGRLEAEVLPHNRAMLRVFEKSGLPITRRQGEGVVHVAMDLG